MTHPAVLGCSILGSAVLQAELEEKGGVSDGMMGKIVGAGQVYLESQRDSAGEWLDGGKNYKNHHCIAVAAPAVEKANFVVVITKTQTRK